MWSLDVILASLLLTVFNVKREPHKMFKYTQIIRR